ncbi:hypothetical protein PCG10_008572 [Penicillium crustosum]|uniref:Uncharacterized protein n=1 Tax=Penicillium crustosum TaxID=36656 RepID=A0A9P5GEJ9_PENCR|nr:hypothetical protein PCG10_008572 [Penicillium crustosum]
MTPLARSFSKETGCGSPNAHHSFGIRNPEKMNFTGHPSAPSGPRSYQGNGGARNNRANNNPNGNASFAANGPRSYQSNGGAQNNRGNNNYNGNANGNRNNRWNGNGNHNNQRDNYQNGSGNFNPTNNGTGNANPSSPNYKGKNFNPNYKGKNYNPNFNRPVPANIGQVRNGNRRRQPNNNHRGLQSQDIQYNIDVQMAEAPSDEPNDIEMPDAPPLPDPVSDLWQAASGLQHALTSLQRIEAFTMGALAVKEIVSPPLSHFQFNPFAFPEPVMNPLAFRPSAPNHPVSHPPISTHPALRPSVFHHPVDNPPASTHPAFGAYAFNYPAFSRPSFRPPTFHPPAAETMLRLASNLDPSYVPNWDPLDSGLANPVLVAERRNNKKS